jgi:hypothetical protein
VSPQTDSAASCPSPLVYSSTWQLCLPG